MGLTLGIDSEASLDSKSSIGGIETATATLPHGYFACARGQQSQVGEDIQGEATAGERQKEERAK